MTEMDKESWLKLNPEETLEPDLEIIDSGMHIVDTPTRHYLPEDFLREKAQQNVKKTVFIQCSFGYRQTGPEEMRVVGETESVQKITADGEKGKYGGIRIAAGIVSWVDLTTGMAVEPLLAAHVEAGNGHFRGIRNATAWDASPAIPRFRFPPKTLENPKFREGVACLKKYGLSFEAFVFFHQLDELTDLAQTFPDTIIVLEHTGSPLTVGPYLTQKEAVFADWKRGIARLANCQNVFIKLGGLGSPESHFGWPLRAMPPGSVEIAATFQPYFAWCIGKFGVERCMFESNFHTDRISYSCNTLWNAFKRLTQGFSASERAALFYGTAERAYRLNDYM
jgi:L-fuconolactonase